MLIDGERTDSLKHLRCEESLQGDQSTRKPLRFIVAQGDRPDPLERRQLLGHLSATERQYLPTEPHVIIEGAGLQVPVAQQQQAQVERLRQHLADGLRDTQRVSPGAKLFGLHPVEGGLVGRQRPIRRHQTIARRQDVEFDRRSGPVRRVGTEDGTHTPHQPHMLLTRVEVLRRHEHVRELLLASCDVLGPLPEVLHGQGRGMVDRLLSGARTDDEDLHGVPIAQVVPLSESAPDEESNRM